MARTKARVAAAHAERQRAPGEALVRKRAAIAKAARVMSVQEVEIATLEREVMHTTRAPFRTNATLARAKLTVLPYAIGPSQVQKLGPVPAAEQIIKLSGQTAHGNGVIRWRGRLRGGGERALEGSWVRRNFKASFLSTVLAAGGTYQHIPTGRAQERPPAALGDPRDGPEVLSAQSAPAISAAECPLIAYRQGNADLCVAFGLASAVHAFGDAAAGAAIASCARAALASGDAFGMCELLCARRRPGGAKLRSLAMIPLPCVSTSPCSCSWSGLMGRARTRWRRSAGWFSTLPRRGRSRSLVPRSIGVWAYTATEQCSRM